MTKEEIHERLDLCVKHIQQGNGIENFPQILEDLKFILMDLKKEERKLSPGQQLKEGSKFLDKSIIFYKELVTKFLQNEYDFSVKIVEDPNIALLGCAGYDEKEDIIRVSAMGFLMGGNSETSILQTLFHETRHRIQKEAYFAKEEEILRYPENMLILLKEDIYEMAYQEEKRKFYRENYSTFYYETDADEFALWATRNILDKMFKQYKKYAEEQNISIPYDLEVLLLQVQKQILMESTKDEAELQDRDRLQSIIRKEASGKVPASTTYVLEEEELDRLIATDKYIKAHPKLQEKYPILRFIMKDERPKTYDEIAREREALLEKHKMDGSISKSIPEGISYEKRIQSFYDCILKSDPILYIQELISYQEYETLKEFLKKHPTIAKEYPLELREIWEKTGNEEISQILTQNKK